MSNPDVKMSDVALVLEAKMPVEYKGLQQYLLDNFSEVPEVLDPQIGWLVRNLAYSRALIAAQAADMAQLRKQVNLLTNALEFMADEVFDV